MTDKPIDFTREYLRRTDEKLDTVLARVEELSVSVSGLLQIAAAQSSHIGRVDQRLDRIEQRLNLVEPNRRVLRAGCQSVAGPGGRASLPLRAR